MFTHSCRLTDFTRTYVYKSLWENANEQYLESKQSWSYLRFYSGKLVGDSLKETRKPSGRVVDEMTDFHFAVSRTL